jgi:quinol monooxygenase YgiN
MAKDTLSVIVRIKARPGKADELKAAIGGLVGPTRKEPGCVRYTFLQNNEDLNDFTLVEEWQDDKALESHFATKHFKDTMEKMPSLVAAEPDIRRYHIVA